MRLETRKALVTGASSGVGRAIALAAARGGAAVCLTGRDGERLRAAAKEAGQAGPPGVRVFHHVADLREEDDIRGLVDAVSRELGGLDLVVHSAGSFGRGPLEQVTSDELDRLYETNLRAVVLLTRALVPLLEVGGGDVVFVNSSVGERSRGGVGAYAATKHGLRAIADAFRDEVNARGIRVLSLYLGRTATPMQERIHDEDGRRYRPERLIQAEEIAEITVAAVALGPSAEVTDLHIRPARKP